MSTSNINIRIEESTKRDLESVCKELGLSVTTAFTIFAKKMCRERRIPFDVAIDPFYSTENLDHLRRSVSELDSGRGLERGLLDADE
ncbi:type II toxin-antitoxin system RelB/DinJ family antitoxin [Collinsella aerofaciens]|jgi:DNA-damage-inducible protein J|uniref:type II toxin-antitoxin system RelB/DinJ family antitoxin n=1 Tax=Collinsella aerofaciens TaxID=74426 RepID=UPI001899D731|nr:type II toxin-antitoxin system RelB/DinJ family antitoxin [Collinsella aerofaciens]MDB1919527.1 type II toxin-antitoxin system RelB/DinJ family antitoxin [Collinsella aerofaciens]